MRTRSIKRFLTGLGVTAVGFYLGDLLFKQLYREDDSADEFHRVTTEDDLDLGLWRYTPDDPDAHREPVLLVHGFSINHRHMCFDERNGVAQYLVEQGYDCWAPDLRGRRSSDVPEEPWLFDDYVRYDIPAIVDYVLSHSEYDRLHWVGHSMGAMLFYAFATSENQKRIASAVTPGSPFHGFQKSNSETPDSDGDPQLTWLERIGKAFRYLPFVNSLDFLPLPFFARWIALFMDAIPKNISLLLLNMDHTSSKRLRYAANEGVDMLSTGVLYQFSDWVINNRWTDFDREMNYRENVQNVEVPTLIIAGELDQMSPVHNLRRGYEAIPAEDKDFRVMGDFEDVNGQYGHIDLIFGDEARDEVFPHIADWLETHSIQESERTEVTGLKE
ncbi:MAG: alpha/beta fold hydrolase [bacterium]